MKGAVISNVGLAVMLAAAFGIPVAGQQPEASALLEESAAMPTPRTADGRPDLTGYWMNPPSSRPRARDNFLDPFGTARPRPTYTDGGNTLILAGRDVPKQDENAQARFKARAADTSLRPPYKPEYVARQRELMYTASNRDPALKCYPRGVPRLGAPQEIVLKPDTVYFMYSSATTHRVVPIGGGSITNLEDAKAWLRDELLDHEALPNGDSIAYWEGDTLVVEAGYFDPETWLTGDGDFHSEEMQVTERFTRVGNTLEYEVIVEDPVLYTEPWRPIGGKYSGAIGSRTLTLGPKDRHVIQDYPCIDRDSQHKVNNDRF